MTWRRALAIFFAMFFLDVAFGFYIIETAARHVLLASLWAAGLQLCNAVLIVSYAKDWRTVFPATAGAFIGTWVAIWLA